MAALCDLLASVERKGIGSIRVIPTSCQEIRKLVPISIGLIGRAANAGAAVEPV
jgi:hypothetical protein